MRGIVRGVAYVLSCVLLVACIALLALTAVLLFSQVAIALRVASLALAATHALPGWLAFWGVLSSPFGGVFRTDFVLAALAAYAVARILRKIARSV